MAGTARCQAITTKGRRCKRFKWFELSELAKLPLVRGEGDYLWYCWEHRTVG